MAEAFFTLYALQRGAYVHAFEPNPEMDDALEKTLALHRFENRATVRRAGLSDEASEHTLIVEPVNLEAASFSDSERKLNKNQKEKGKRV
ncbi:hypothetical protein [Fervidobacterium thailandense]|uniref:FkbM family methyltransferase n=1 Tax=Fervidobacterium thailandense TaxID=1008305 RepID=A0A1E3G1V4_9BACT|nr:hypothetical protein [Fervidobacterium thailandense]ODN30249.1 hypothetical protein A4H02_06745 [Fervidobacterium thailandense]